jgi:hypothetical protein
MSNISQNAERSLELYAQGKWEVLIGLAGYEGGSVEVQRARATELAKRVGELEDDISYYLDEYLPLVPID